MTEASGALLWLAPALLPLAASVLLLPALRRAQALLPLAALPALGVALLAPAGTVELPWLLLGAHFGLDATTRIFLLLTAALWLAGGVHALGYLRADPRRARFWLFWLLTMAGNLGLVLAQDAASFAVFFALMSLAAYGLVVHTDTPAARRAGRIYLALVVVGEVAIFAALALAWHAAGSLRFAEIAAALPGAATRDLVIALTLLGFGIKVGALPLHVWLPLAHPVAPTPASAVLSGAMLKAGLLGWLQLLPLGALAAPGWGQWLVALGLAAAFAAALAATTQRDAKAALAYSSISQMGFVTVAVGVGLARPEDAAAATAAAALYALHHAFAKAALFLGVSLAGARSPAARALWAAGMAWAALALIGAPLTSGLLAKDELKAVALALGDALPWALTLAAALTTLAMLRVGWLLRAAGSAASGDTQASAPAAPMWLAWAALLLGAPLAALWVGGTGQLPLSWAQAAGALWPLALGVGLAALAVAIRNRQPQPAALPLLPPGDLLWPLLAALAPLRRPPALRALHAALPRHVGLPPTAPAPAADPADDTRAADAAERWLARLAGPAMAALALVLVLLLILAR
jgi:formate hydrogenlyase subunit 3/multisubunit Na+/H+ antiporter MnhD subunit